MTLQASIRPYLNQAYLLGLLMVAVGLTLSPFLMGMSQFWLVLVWLVDGFTANRYCRLVPQSPKHMETNHRMGDDRSLSAMTDRGFKAKLSCFWHNTPAVLLVAFYLLHVVGLLWTSDFEYALKDLRVKLPILIMPLVLSGMEPLDRKRFNFVMLVYVVSVFVATLFSSVSYWRHDYEDIREISHFISHIRFCLNIVFCIAIIGYYIFEMRVSRRNNVPAFGLKVAVNQFLMWFLLFWFVYQIYIFESLSGYVILAVVVIVTLVYAFLQWKKSKGWHIAMAVLASLIVAVAFFIVQHEVKPLLKVEPVDFATLEQKTAQGNDY